MPELRHVFISYGRKESKAFATRLYERLELEGYKVWFDQNDIPLAVDFQDEIDEGIARADNFIFVIAPHSVNSVYCLKEIELALKFKKRIIPIIHIEEFGRDEWESRVPNGRDEDWAKFKAEGRHTSFQNMHPEIGKRNWVYMRERCVGGTPIENYPSIDDFEENFLKLNGLLQHHRDHVRQHTVLLNRALEWERNQRKTQFLLVGEERTAAEKWMLKKFGNEQAPVIPSDLQCLYISEARKNAENRMTDIFICYATPNKIIRDKVILALSRYCLTTWTHDHDIKSGQSSKEAIEEGIEKSDNILFFISKDSIESEHCIHELRYALSLNKRIIPLMIEEVLPENLPKEVRDLQFVDFTDNVKEEDFYDDIGEILRQFEGDQNYHERHKLLLVQALKWQRQNENPSILLRGHNLQRAQAWLKIGIQRNTHKPTELHQRFIQKSATLSGSLQSINVFISYSRTDSDFARHLNDRLQLSGKTTWFDQESIDEGVADFGAEIRKGIDQSENFLFIISPDSVKSRYCREETEYAEQLGKRIITLRLRDLPDDVSLPEVLSNIQWIDAQKGFEPMFNLLTRTLELDREHIEAHSRWQRKSLEWSEGAFEFKDDTKTDDSHLLRSDELRRAESWLEEAERENKKPLVTKLQKAFITASTEASERNRKAQERIRDASILVFAILITAGFLTATQLIKSVQRGDQVTTHDLLFEARSRLAYDTTQALRLAKAAYEFNEFKNEAALLDFYQLTTAKIRGSKPDAPALVRRFGHNDPVIGVYTEQMKGAKSPIIVTLDAKMGLKLWHQDGRLIRELLKPHHTLSDFEGKSELERLELMYNLYQDYANRVQISEEGCILAYLEDKEGKYSVYSWNYAGDLLMKRQVDKRVEQAGFTMDIGRQLELYWHEITPNGQTTQVFATPQGDAIREEDLGVQNFSDEYYGRNDRPFSADAIRAYWDTSELGILPNYDGIFLKYLPKNKVTDSLGFSYGSEVIKEQENFSIIGIPRFFDSDIMVMGENALLIWKPYHTFADKLSHLEPLTIAEKNRYDTASLMESLQSKPKAAYLLSQATLFTLVFLISVAFLYQFYGYFIQGRFLSILMHALNIVLVVLCWAQFMPYRMLVIPLAFSYGLMGSLACFLGARWEYKKSRNPLRVSLRVASGVILFILSASCLFFAWEEYMGEAGELARTQAVSLVLFLLIVKIGLFGLVMFGTKRLAAKNYRFFSDITTAWVLWAVVALAVSVYYGPSDSEKKGWVLILLFGVFMPLVYTFRFNFDQFLKARIYRKRSAKLLLRFSLIGFGVVLLLLFASFLIQDALIILAGWLFLYLFIEYIASFVVAIVQKDRWALLGNIGATVGIIILLTLMFQEVSRHDVSYYATRGLFTMILLGAGVFFWRRRKQRAVSKSE
ncbi:MAG: TIR domain-containing protein [Bacteroidota bacterium]